MSSSPVTVPVNAISRDVDVSITINRPQTELQSDLSRLCFVSSETTFPPNNGRARVYSSFDSVLQDTGWNATNTGWWAAKAFFDQDVRPQQFVLGAVFEDAIPAQLMGAVITDYSALAAISDGSFMVTVTNESGTPAVINVEGVNLTGVTNTAGIVTAINTAIADGSQSGELASESAYGGRLILNARGTNITISYADPGTAGTDVSALLGLTQEVGAQKWDAYTPAGLVSEIQLIAAAARVNGFNVFAWALDKKYRDTAEQRAVSDWAEAQTWKAWAVQCTNAPTSYDSADTTNIAYYAHNLGYRATSVQYSSYPQQYPEIAYAMPVLAVDYTLQDSVVTACFKDAVGVSPENITENQLTTLAARRCNVFVLVGNNARTQRYGMQAADTWWTDSYAGACNFREQIQVNVANALYRNKKIPYTSKGQTVIVSAIGNACGQYEYNGYLAEREVAVTNTETGATANPAYTISPTPIFRATQTQRANRILPPIQVTCYEAGAIHHVDIFVDLVN